MNAQEMVDQVKLKLADEVDPRAFEDADILVALNDAQNEFARRTLCLFEGDKTITGTPVGGLLNLPAEVLWLTSVTVGTPLRIVTQQKLDFGYFDLNGTEVSSRFTGWRQAVGDPVFCIPDYGMQNLRFVPKPSVSISVELEYYRLPVAAISLAPAVNAEVPAAYHSDLVVGALAYLFSVPDFETYNADLAEIKRALWRGRIAIANRILQTDLRMQTDLPTPPPGVDFIQPTGT